MGAVVLRRPAGGEHSLTFAERALYHQIHFYAAWYRVPAGVLGGLALVAVCWANGIVRRRLA
jgi:hypothetical protein